MCTCNKGRVKDYDVNKTKWMNQQKILKRKNPDLIKEILYSKDEKFSLIFIYW